MFHDHSVHLRLSRVLPLSQTLDPSPVRVSQRTIGIRTQTIGEACWAIIYTIPHSSMSISVRTRSDKPSTLEWLKLNATHHRLTHVPYPAIRASNYAIASRQAISLIRGSSRATLSHSSSTRNYTRFVSIPTLTRNERFLLSIPTASPPSTPTRAD
jgi:hypothetical protein